MRISHKLLVVAVLITVLVLLIPTSVATAADEVDFPDLVLQEAIRDAIGGGDITQAKLDLLTNFSYGSGSLPNVTDLTGMEHCTSLTVLYLGYNQISDITPLSNLTSLYNLFLSANQISDITPLSNLTSLTNLNLGWNQISDITPLSNLTSLTELMLSLNQISDITPLSNLTSLTHLYFGSNPISDITPLSNLTSLETLNLHTNQISDITPLSNLTSLYNLFLDSNQISDIKPLVDNSGISAGDYVDLSNNPLSADSINIYIPELQAREVEVRYDEPTPSNGNGEGGCFIATAAYGSYLDSHVETLRDFRDSYLVTNPVGSALVSAYYKLSPPVADFIDDHPALKPIVRAALLPAVAMSTVAVSTTLAEKVAIVGSLALVSVALAMWLSRRRGKGVIF